MKRLTRSENLQGTRSSLYRMLDKPDFKRKTEKNFHIHKIQSKSSKVSNFLSTANLKFTHNMKSERKPEKHVTKEKTEEFVPIRPISKN